MSRRKLTEKGFVLLGVLRRLGIYQESQNLVYQDWAQEVYERLMEQCAVFEPETSLFLYAKDAKALCPDDGQRFDALEDLLGLDRVTFFRVISIEESSHRRSGKGRYSVCIKMRALQEILQNSV